MDIVYISVLVYVNIESLAWLESTLPYAIYLFLSLVLRYLYLPLVLIQCNFLIHNFWYFFVFFLFFHYFFTKIKKNYQKIFNFDFFRKKNDFFKKNPIFSASNQCSEKTISACMYKNRCYCYLWKRRWAVDDTVCCYFTSFHCCFSVSYTNFICCCCCFFIFKAIFIHAAASAVQW